MRLSPPPWQDITTIARGLQTIGQPEIQKHFLWPAIALLFYGFTPLRLAHFPIPVAQHDLLRIGRSRFSLIKHAVDKFVELAQVEEAQGRYRHLIESYF